MREPKIRFHRNLPHPGRVNPEDGPVARIGTPEWQAWFDWYSAKKREFSCSMMEHYAANKTDWPVPSTWPPR